MWGEGQGPEVPALPQRPPPNPQTGRGRRSLGLRLPRLKKCKGWGAGFGEGEGPLAPPIRNHRFQYTRTNLFISDQRKSSSPL